MSVSWLLLRAGVRGLGHWSGHGDWAVELNQMLSQSLIARKIRIIIRFSRVDFCESEMLKVVVGNHRWHLHCCV